MTINLTQLNCLYAGYPDNIKNSVIKEKCRQLMLNVSRTQTEKDKTSNTEIGFSLYFYTFLTPVVILIGLLGNILCIKIFTRRRSKKQTTSIYFAGLSIADLLVLLIYVLPEWLEKGLFVVTDNTNFMLRSHQYVCQIFLYASYCLRLLSVWMLVISTFERYVGVCHPLWRREICSKKMAKKIIISVVILTLLFCLWKPILSTVKDNNCTTAERHDVKSRILDSIFAALLSVIPSFIILILNMFISKRLLIIRGSDNKNIRSRREMIGIQFAGLLLVVSSCFFLLTWPYYICWIINVVQWYMNWLGTRDGSSRQLALNVTLESSKDFYNYAYVDYDANFLTKPYVTQITRAIFYINYSINFFLYTFSSTYFRAEMKRMFTIRQKAVANPSEQPSLFQTDTEKKRKQHIPCRVFN